MNTNNKKKLLTLIENLFSGKASVKEITKLFNFFQSHQSMTTWEEELGDRKTVEKRIFHNIQNEIRDKGSVRNTKSIFLKNNLLKYAAVILLGGLISYVYFKNEVPSPIQDIEVVKNNIETGTNKATLTLKDGSQILLEKGKVYKSPNVNSDGVEIVYADQQGKEMDSEIEFNYLTIPRGGQFVVKLSDGTTVWLNSESQLKYPTHFMAGQPRKVELMYGEAYFDVTPSSLHDGRVFQVHSKDQNIEVIGTQFNLKAYKDEATMYTTLVEGKVLVSHQDKSQVLLPEQQYAYNIIDKTSTIANVNVFNEVSWRNGVFSFENKSLKEIMTVLSRWYDMTVKFENKDIENEEFIGVLYKDRSIESILKNIQSVGTIESYEINDRNVILK